MHPSTHNWMRAERLDTALRRAKRLGDAAKSAETPLPLIG